MIDKKEKTAFTLAEVMIVLLVLTILFAAFAPFITKRQRNKANKQETWMWSSRNYLAGPMDTYYRPLSNSYLGGIYVGTTPDSDYDITSSYLPISKFVIRSGYIANNKIQRQLQLRYGRSSFEDPGQLAATFIADNENLLFGGIYPHLTSKCSNISYPSGNIAFGYLALNSTRDAIYDMMQRTCDSSKTNVGDKSENNTAFGNLSMVINYAGHDNTTFGAKTGYVNLAGSRNTYIGYNAGSDAESNYSTLVGYNSQALIGDYNTFIGSFTGNSRKDESITGNRDYRYNVALGYKALSNITSGKYNVAVGAGALGNLTTGHYNTAIGYNACYGITKQSYKTCIGANSGPAADTPVYEDLKLLSNDETPRTYIGANPNLKIVEPNSEGEGTTNWQWESKGYYGGDAVMEIHNSVGHINSSLINNPGIKSNATTIINGNLVVRGKTFLTMGNVLYPFYYSNNIFGTNSNVNCAANQLTYQFSNAGECATLAPITESTSDRRLKNVLGRNSDGLDKIKQLKVYNYKFKNDKNKKLHVGVIAQDLQKIFPNSVFTGEDYYLKIRIDEMFYAVINSLKELNEKIVSLIKNTIKLEEEISKAEKENEKLKTQVEALTMRINALKKK